MIVPDGRTVTLSIENAVAELDKIKAAMDASLRLIRFCFVVDRHFIVVPSCAGINRRGVVNERVIR